MVALVAGTRCLIALVTRSTHYLSPSSGRQNAAGMNESDSDAVYSPDQTNNFARILSENWHRKNEIGKTQDLFPSADKSVKKIGRKRSVMHEFYSWMAIHSMLIEQPFPNRCICELTKWNNAR